MSLTRSLSINVAGKGPIQKAIAILRKYGTNAHVYLPGVGTLSGITAGNYLDSAGVTAASVDNPVGLSLDALQAMTLGSELVTNPTINSIAIGGPAFTYYAPGGSVISGKKYKVSYTVSAYSGSDTIGASNFSGAPELSGNGNVSFILDAASTGSLSFYTRSSNQCTFTNISVREIPGIHATQGTTANKAFLRRGLLNQLLYSQDLSNAVWSKHRVGFTTGQIGPDGSTTATLIYPNSTGSFPGVYQNTTRASGVDSTTFRLKAAGFSWVVIISASGSASFAAWFNLTTGVKGSVAGGIASSIVPVSNGFYDCTITSPASANPLAQFAVVGGDGSTTATASGTNGVIVSIAGLFQGTYSAQQILDAGGIPLTTTAAASNPSAGKYSWQFDGSNDSLGLSAPLFQMSDDHAVIAGANCTSNISDRNIFSQRSSIATAPIVGTLNVSSGFPKATWRDDTSAIEALTSPTLASGNYVSSLRKVSNAKVLRVNGLQVASGFTVLGASSINSVSIGCSPVSSPDSFFQGSIYPVIAIKGTVSDSDLLTLERFVGQLSGVSL